MVKSVKFCFISFLIIFPFLLIGQTKDVDFFKLRAKELFSKGRDLSYDGRDIEALDTFKLYLDYRIKAYGQKNYYLGSAYSAVGVAYKNIGQLDMALQNYKLAEKNFLLRDDPYLSSLAGLYINIGNIYRAKLDYKNAINYYYQALNIYEHQKSVSTQNVSNATYALAEIYYLQKQYEIVVDKILKNYTSADTLNQIYYCNILAGSHFALKTFEKAEEYYLQGISLLKLYFGENDNELAFALINFAQFLSEINRFEEAILNMNKAYQIFYLNKQSNGEELAHYYYAMGEILKNKPISTQSILSFKQQKQQNLNEAINWYNKSLNALNPSKGNMAPDSITIDKCISFMTCLKSLKTIADTYHELAVLNKDDKNSFYLSSLNDALHYYQITSQLTQRARKEISSDESKIQLAELEHSTFTKIIETAYLTYELTNDEKYLELAFNNSEQIKSSAIFDKLSNDLAQDNSLIPDSLLELEKRLNATISIYSEKIFKESSMDEPDTILLNEYNNKVFDANKNRDELNRFMEKQYPDYYDLKYSTKMLSVSNIQKRIKKNDAIIEYVIIENDDDRDKSKQNKTTELYSFFISKNDKQFVRKSIDKTTENSLEEVFHFMSTPNYIFTQNEDSKQFCTSSYSMYNLLISPFESNLRDKNLIVIPDGKLNYISFDGLLKTLPDTSKYIDFTKLDYLIKDLNINYANSANILIKNRSSKRHFKNHIMAFAPEYQSEKFELSNATYTLLPLQGIKNEVKAIAETVTTTIFSAEEASEENFRANCQNYDILHLAMHAFINDSLPAYSRLAFSPVSPSNDLQKDGWLNTADIYNLDLNANLAVLSACNTGIGKLKKGEGLMSLARGFLYAGCPSVIMSLWEVEDQAGTKIMTSFYKNLKHGKTKDEALRLAKIHYLENSNSRMAHPHYWMSFKCIGDNSPIYTSYDIYFFGLLLLLIIIFTAEQTIRIRKIRKKRRG